MERKNSLVWACETEWVVVIYAEMENNGRRMGLRRH